MRRRIFLGNGGKKWKSGNGFFQKRCYKKKERRKEGSGDETFLIGVCAHTTQFSLHMQSGSSQSFLRDSGFPFFFGGKKPMHHYRDIDHTIVVLHFADHLPMFLNTLNSENMSWHHTRQCIESAAPQQFFFCTWAGPSAKWPTRLITLRSRLVRCFHLASFRVRFLIRALPSIPLFIISFPPTHLLSVNLFPFQDIARVHPGRAQWFGKFFLFTIVGLILRPGHVQNKYEPCMVVAHVLFVDDESRGDSICQFVCFLFHVMELSFSNFWCFLHDLLLIFDTDHWILEVQLHRLKLPNVSSNFLPRVEEGG